jgi:ADP-ribose pyrophosphatase
MTTSTSNPQPSNTNPALHEKTLSSTPQHRGLVINVRRDEVELPNGRKALREVAEHPGGVVVLPLLEDGRIIFVEQFRYPLGHTLLELPAGKLEPGEAPLVSIQRELIEETGYEATQWEELNHIYTAPGFCNEKLWLFKATGLKQIHETGTCSHNPEEQIEFLNLVYLHRDEALDRLRRQEFTDAKTICLLSLALI